MSSVESVEMEGDCLGPEDLCVCVCVYVCVHYLVCLLMNGILCSIYEIRIRMPLVFFCQKLLSISTNLNFQTFANFKLVLLSISTVVNSNSKFHMKPTFARKFPPACVLPRASISFQLQQRKSTRARERVCESERESKSESERERARVRERERERERKRERDTHTNTHV